jgi:hypothetical protein
MEDHRHHLDALTGDPGYGPLLRTERETPSFNRAWLKDGEKLTVLQRAGFTIFSLFFLAVGLVLAGYAAMAYEDGSFFALVVALVCLFFMAIGILGLRNVLRFPKASPSRE